MVIPSLIIGLGGAGQKVAACAKGELLRLGGGRLPPAVRLLVFDTAQRFTVSRETAGQASRSPLAVLDDPGEYLYLGQKEEFIAYVQEVAQGRHPHVTTWFLAREHAALLARSDFGWGESAASFRQLGRLALFYDLHSPARSRVYPLLSDAIGRIRDDSGEKSVQVLIVASLVGTGGAGMVIDIAYLARRLARQAGLTPTLRGYLLLPEAFRYLADAESLPAMRARAYAVLRELRRLSSDVNLQGGGIPFVYRPQERDSLWCGELDSPLFDSVYLLDGQRPNLSLCEVPLERGLAPSLADAICTLVDPQAGQPMREHKLNLQGVLQERQRLGTLPPDTAAFGALGSYTIVFPIQSIVQSWSLRLALELLDTLLRPTEPDPQSGLPIHLAPDANLEREGHRGRDEVNDFLACTHVPDPQNPSRGVDLPPWLAAVTSHATGDPSAVAQLRGWGIEDWYQLFEPPGQDDESLQLRGQMRQAFRSRLTEPEVILTRDRTSREPLAESAARIARQVRDFRDTCLGAEDPTTGQYTGGRCRQVLGQCAQIHRCRFELALRFHLLALLNGQGRTDARRSKGGKLGYTHDFLLGLAETLDHTLQTLKALQSSRMVPSRRRLEMRDRADHRLNEMARTARKRHLLAGREMARRQKEYLAQEQELVDLRRLEVLDQVAVETLEEMLRQVQHLEAQVAQWVDALALGQESVYGDLLRGQQQVEEDRAAQEKIVVRLMVRDAQFEDERYRFYAYKAGQDAVERLLEGLSWELSPIGSAPSTTGLRLVWRAPGGEAPRILLPDPHAGEVLLSLCRPVFDDALHSESVLGYLRYAYPDPNDLADLISRQGGVLLGHRAPDPLRANYLRVAQPHGEEKSYLEGLLQRLSQLASQSVGPGGRAQRFAYVVHSADRFQCSLIHTEELLPLDTLDAWGPQARDDYWHYRQELQIRGLDRRFLHALPAEVNAARYEDQLHPRRFLVPEVVFHLERHGRMRLFLMAFLHGLIKKDVRQPRGEVYTVWVLALPPEREENCWLLTPEGGDSQLLEALTTFTCVGQDQERPHHYRHPLDYARVEEAVKERRLADARQRVEAGTAGQHLGLRRHLINSLDGREREVAALTAAQVDWLAEKEGRLRAEVAALEAAPPTVEAQRMADLLSVFALMLREEMARLEEEIRELVWIGLGGVRPLSLDSPWG